LFSRVAPSASGVRGPKKKKGGKADAGPISTDIVNIFKGRSDPLIYPSEMYPPWVMGLLEDQYGPDDVMI
jgi:hypothetical protein